MSTIKPLFSWRSAIADSDLPPTTRHVALALSTYMSERGDSAFPGAERLAHDTALHVSTVREKLGQLVETGWLVMLERGGTKGVKRHANVYQASVPLAHGDGSIWDTPRPGLATPRPNRADPSPTATPSLQDLTKTSGNDPVDNDVDWRPSEEELQVGRAVAGSLLKHMRERHGLG